MPRRTDTRPRKAPTQERARATVERILAAATRLLVTEGYDRASTNRIAQEAGISPGSLYQYFPHKDAIVLAIAERTREQLERDIAEQLSHMLDLSPVAVAQHIIGALVDALAQQREILRAIVENVPHAAGLETFASFEQRVGDLLRGFLAARPSLLRDVDLDTAIWMAVQAVEQLSIRYVLEQPPVPRDRFVDELATMTISYLVRPDLAPAAHEVRRRA